MRFDGVNAGREGVGSSNIAVMTRNEALPRQPDIVVYYEGANQALCTLPAPDAPPRPPPAQDSLTGLDGWAAQWEHVSALARRVRGVIALARDGRRRAPEARAAAESAARRRTAPLRSWTPPTCPRRSGPF